MRILKLDVRNAWFEVIPENAEDLWHLEKVLEKGDLVSGSSTRKIKGKTEGEKAEKRPIFVEVQAETIEYQAVPGQLRVNGLVTRGTPEEYVEVKSFHTLEIEPDKKIGVKKQVLKQWQVERLERAKQSGAREQLLAIVLDDEAAELAMVRETGFEVKARIQAGKEGKRFGGGGGAAGKQKYFDEVVQTVLGLKPEKVLIAGPGFTKDELKKFLAEKRVKLAAVYESTNSTGETGLNELLREGKLGKATEELELSRETQAVEAVLMHTGKNDGLAEYGLKEVGAALRAGAVERLLVAEERLRNARKETEELMDEAERQRVEVKVIGAHHESGKKLLGLGGVAAVLRYKFR